MNAALDGISSKICFAVPTPCCRRDITDAIEVIAFCAVSAMVPIGSPSPNVLLSHFAICMLFYYNFSLMF